MTAGDLEPLATLEEYESRYGAVEGDRRAQVESALSDASALILAEVPGYVPGGDPVFDRNMAAVCREMVHRAMERPAWAEGVTQAQQTAGSLSASVSLSNPDGALYLSRSDRRRLGLDDCAVATVAMSAARGGSRGC